MKIGILISRRGSNMAAIADAVASGEIAGASFTVEAERGGKVAFCLGAEAFGKQILCAEIAAAYNAVNLQN